VHTTTTYVLTNEKKKKKSLLSRFIPTTCLSLALTLGAAIDRWIEHHFFRVKRAKCLVLIGPTGTGKTSFALSLPGQVNYFQGRWNLDSWSDYARYSVYDDVPWDQFEDWNYPFKKSLLTQNGKLNVSERWKSNDERVYDS
jgi:energy-coupling factor transporter ATP-binding protein EcfA2